jgi:hypothetical protein
MLIRKMIADFNLTLVINLTDDYGVIAKNSFTQNIFVHISQCQIETTTPTTLRLSYTYELNSGKIAFKTSDYF